MKNQIRIHEATTIRDISRFWEQLQAYFKRDIFPDPEDEDREYFLSETEYWSEIQRIHERAQDPCYFLYFQCDDREIGFCMPIIFRSEDYKCFIMEFCVYPEYRGNGTGRDCAKALLDWAKALGARYAELNYGGHTRRRRFWELTGFMDNGVDEWGNPLMLLPPPDDVPYSFELFHAHDTCQLKRLENGFLKEIGESVLSDERQRKLSDAIQTGKIVFFVAKRGYRVVGMCSVSRCFSTFSCDDVGIFDDFYIEPVFRKKGIARKLVQFVAAWCKSNGISSLTVCCAPCDELMYQSLGFDSSLGKTLAAVL